MLDLLQQHADDDVLEQQVMADVDTTEETILPERHWQHIWNGMQKRMHTAVPAQPRLLVPVWLRVAAVLVCIATAAVIWRQTHTPASNAPEQWVSKPSVVTPGTDKAVLTLSNGSRILLDSAHQGSITGENGISITNLQGSNLAYGEQKQGARPQAVTYNTLTTPRGGVYQLSLADGSRVWLNAASSITFPTTFIGAERRVTITGEAYFEVAAQAGKPFKVEANGSLTEVLGTSFNIMSYTDEDVLKTTLVNGSVKVSSGTASVLLHPGQQAIRNQAGMIQVAPADMDEVLSWKNGLISFSGAPLPVVMRRIARWYDVELMYKGKMPEDNFNGIIDRKLPLKNVLKVMEIYGIKYKLDGNKLTLIF